MQGSGGGGIGQSFQLSFSPTFVPFGGIPGQNPFTPLPRGTVPNLADCLSFLTQLTYGPSDPVLSDRSRFPSLYQMATRDGALAQGILALLLHFGWTWVALFVSDDMRGEWFLQELSGEMFLKGVCVALTVKLPGMGRMYAPSDVTFMNSIPASNASVHILYGDVRALVHVDTSGESFLTLGKVWVMVCKRDLVVYETTPPAALFPWGLLLFPLP